MADARQQDVKEEAGGTRGEREGEESSSPGVLISFERSSWVISPLEITICEADRFDGFIQGEERQRTVLHWETFLQIKIKEVILY